jgi:GH15 family glucan-1,4-alpha-glucosidase
MRSQPRSAPAIADYGLIGDGRTAALCSAEGSIDWLCLPRFDSEPVFGRLVGGERAGCFSLRVEDVQETTRRYREGSAVLETRWRTSTGAVTLTEGMVVDVERRLLPRALLVRRLECSGAPAPVRIRFDPRAGLTGAILRSVSRREALICTRGSLAIALRVAPQLKLDAGRETTVLLEPARPLTMALMVADREPLVFVSPDEAFRSLEDTDRWWRAWISRITYQGPAAALVLRSLITLRLLTYSPSGAPVAAPTTSLPEEVGGERNWDYRYSWPRDASIGVAAFLELGLHEEAHSFLHWLLMAGRLSRPRLRVLYTIDGKPGAPEREIDGAPGFRGSTPVRVGNAAGTQHQLDVYGWVVDAAWALVRSGDTLEPQMWRAVAGFADFVAGSWRDPDAGVWEVRDTTAHYVHSKLMAWFALDRADRMAGSNRIRASRVERWRRERDALAAEIRERGFDPLRGTYVRAYGSTELDAALLFLPLLEFEGEGSPRITGTIDAIRKELRAGGALLNRYPPGSDGLEGKEGAFLPCSFWLVGALARTGRLEEAHRLFDELLARSNDLGLYSEEMDPDTGEHLGNFPQALTHASLVQAALALAAATRDGGSRPARRHTPREPAG